jgi:hypothetical protein
MSAPLLTKRTFITLRFPGSFLPEEITEEVASPLIPKEIPRDCYGFSFSQDQAATVGGIKMTSQRLPLPLEYIVGWEIPLKEIPDTNEFRILRANVENNSERKMAIRTRMGNWQISDFVYVIDPDEFTYGEPRIYKKAIPLTGPMDALSR